MNQNTEQKARGRTDRQLTVCGRIIQNKIFIVYAAIGVDDPEYSTDETPAKLFSFC